MDVPYNGESGIECDKCNTQTVDGDVLYHCPVEGCEVDYCANCV